MGETSMSLMQGTVDLLILRALQADSPAHGYTVSRFVHSRTDGVLALEDAALYQALPPRSAGTHRSRVGALGKQPPREVLSAYCRRPQATARRHFGVAGVRSRDLQRARWP